MDQSSIIILAHNDFGTVKECVESVIQNADNYEIVFVIDNIIPFKEYLEKFGKVIIGPDPFNFAQRVNIGIAAAQGEYIVLLNDDTKVQPGWLDKMISDNQSLGPGLVGARCQPGGCSNRQTWGEGSAMYTKYTLNMFATLIPRRVIDVIGPLDERFVYYGGEDCDYSLRAERHLFKRVISRGFVWHKVSTSFTHEKIVSLLPKTREIFRDKWGVDLPIPPEQSWRDSVRAEYLKPLVSILMATRNHEKYIAAAIKSVLDQDYYNFELLIGIDGPDQQETVKIIAGFQDARIKIISSAEKLGSCAMRSRLFEEPKGEFIAIMDSDDLMLGSRLTRELALFKDFPDTDIVHSEVIREDESGAQKKMELRPLNRKILLSGNNFIAGGTFLMRRYVMENCNLNSDYDRAFDFEFALRNYGRFKFKYLNEPTLVYRRHSGEHLSGNSESARLHKELIKEYGP